MSRIPKFADELSFDRRPGGAAGVKKEAGEFRLGPLTCFLLGFFSGVAAILVFGDPNIFRFLHF